MDRIDLEEIAENHGYGKEAAKVLHGMSVTMLHYFVSHADRVDNGSGSEMFCVVPANTRRALWSRQLLTSGGQTRDMRRWCKPSEFGYRVLGLHKLTKGL